MVTLRDVKPGFAVRIQALNDCAIKTRLLSMGLTKGTEVKVVRSAPFGGPIAIQVRDYTLCLRRKDAEKIEVTLL